MSKTLKYDINRERVKLEIEGITVKIDLKDIVDAEVERRLEEVQLPFNIENTYKRADGNTYRAVLYAQLLASSAPNRTVFYLTHTQSYARILRLKVADSIVNLVGLEMTPANNMIELENGSRIIFMSEENFDRTNSKWGLNDMHVVYDNSL